MADVKALLNKFATRGISTKEVIQLRQAVHSDGPNVPGEARHVTKDELRAMKKGLSEFKDKFSSPAAKAEYERFVGLYAEKAGKVVEKYEEFGDLWKIQRDPAFRAKWGITQKDDPGAPTFTTPTTLKALPPGLQEKFENFATKFLRTPTKAVSAERIFDRNHNHIGYALRSDDRDGFTSYYRKDGTPAGISSDPPMD